MERPYSTPFYGRSQRRMESPAIGGPFFRLKKAPTMEVTSVAWSRAVVAIVLEVSQYASHSRDRYWPEADFT